MEWGGAVEQNAKLKANARSLRKNQTKEESLLWYRFLNKYPLRFRRQYIIGNYIADFYCHRAKLIVELDGSQHYEEAEKQYDEKRTTYFHSQGIEVLRFSNLDVLREFDNVCTMIHTIIQHRTQIPSPGAHNAKIPSPGGGAPRSES